MTDGENAETAAQRAQHADQDGGMEDEKPLVEAGQARENVRVAKRTLASVRRDLRQGAEALGRATHGLDRSKSEFEDECPTGRRRNDVDATLGYLRASAEDLEEVCDCIEGLCQALTEEHVETRQELETEMAAIEEVLVEAIDERFEELAGEIATVRSTQERLVREAGLVASRRHESTGEPTVQP